MYQTNDLKQPTGHSMNQWKKCPRPSTAPMIGQYCTVTQLDPLIHAKSLFQMFSVANSEGDWTYLPYGPFNNVDDFTEWLYAECTGEDPLFYALIDNQNGNAVGLTSYLRIEPAIGVMEVGHIHFSPILQKTPMATEAMYLMMRHVFEEQGYRRYEWKCDSCNENSKRAALRLGFKLEGTFRQANIYKGRNRDTTWFSMLDSEWPQRKAALERWLQPSNFDSSDIQQCSLQECI